MAEPLAPQSEEKKTFKELGVRDEICEACEKMGFKFSTPIQQQSIPHGLSGRDIIGLAQTGSGKTAAFAIPILQKLLESGGRTRDIYACVLAPTRELCFQIAEQFEALGSVIGVKCAVIVGGVDMVQQSIALAKKPHVVVGTPGRVVDHLEHTGGFTLKNIRFLVMDEADRLFNMDFEEELNKILEVVSPKDLRQTFLFSATMTTKVAKLQRASLTKPVTVEVSTKYATVDTLIQQYVFVPAKYKDCYLTFILNELAGSTVIVFVHTCNSAHRLALMLRTLGFKAVPLHGQMPQAKRLGALNKFKAGERNILIATDVASRGLDIPTVDAVFNYDIPMHSKDYVHRVGRTARAGRAGRAITYVTQYDVELFQRIEAMLGKKLTLYPTDEAEVLTLQERVGEATRLAIHEMKDSLPGSKKGRDADAPEEYQQQPKLKKHAGQRRR
eukprot:TRINITY_DN12744_c0_g1_i1.p1 TRINITY_DN12744_c0_g1~~TRINITY_DN12744_c0_g1_i1.p1  ORF type:complete len:462 (+),score=91.02 TRINITY_DN12744_c0_g1_i1:58-1386(+)